MDSMHMVLYEPQMGVVRAAGSKHVVFGEPRAGTAAATRSNPYRRLLQSGSGRKRMNDLYS